MEQQLDEAHCQLEEARADLQAARTQLTKNARGLTYNRAQVGKLETVLAVLRNQLEASNSATVCSKVLAVSISQMTIGAAQPIAASAAPHPTGVPMFPALAPPLQATAMPTGVTDTATTVAHTPAQLATGHPYAVYPPPPGFPYPPAGYSPYWGMYPYLYPQYVPPLLPVHPGESVPLMAAPLSLPVPEPHPTQVAMDPATYRTMTATADSSMFATAQTLPALSEETSMPPLVALNDAPELMESAAKGQGAICTVTPTSRTYGRS